GETWKAIDRALQQGVRGFPGGSSLAKLLVARRGKRNHTNLPPLTVGQILAWADGHQQRTGACPKTMPGPVHGVPGETWSGINASLQQGKRGLPDGSSLAKLLAQHRGVRNTSDPPPLTIDQVLVWADAHHRRTGDWPVVKAGPVEEAP